MPYNAAYIGFVYTSLGLKGHRDGWWWREGQRRGSWLHLQIEGTQGELLNADARSADSNPDSMCSRWEDGLITVLGSEGDEADARDTRRGCRQDLTCGSH